MSCSTCLHSWRLEWSVERDLAQTNSKCFATKTAIDLPTWKTAYQYKQTAEIFQHAKFPNYYFVKSVGNSHPLSELVIERYLVLMESGNFSSFNQFVSTALGYWRVTMPDLAYESNLFLATCTCTLYSKNCICKHVVAVGLRLKFATQCMPMAAKTIQLGQKRSRGKPGLALPALLRQPSIYASILLNEDDEAADDFEDDAPSSTNNQQQQQQQQQPPIVN